MRGTRSHSPMPPLGPTRRRFVQAGGASFFGGMSLPRLLRGAERAKDSITPKIRSVILFNLLGGPSHIDMFDMKPDAPEGIRGEFGSIETSLPGLRICELLPNTARLMHKACLIRTISHTYDSHDPMAIMTGFTRGNPQLQAQPTDPPDIGAICQYVGLGPKDVPGAVCLPCYPGWGQNGYRRGGRKRQVIRRAQMIRRVGRESFVGCGVVVRHGLGLPLCLTSRFGCLYIS